MDTDSFLTTLIILPNDYHVFLFIMRTEINWFYISTRDVYFHYFVSRHQEETYILSITGTVMPLMQRDIYYKCKRPIYEKFTVGRQYS